MLLPSSLPTNVLVELVVQVSTDHQGHRTTERTAIPFPHQLLEALRLMSNQTWW